MGPTFPHGSACVSMLGGVEASREAKGSMRESMREPTGQFKYVKTPIVYTAAVLLALGKLTWRSSHLPNT